MDYVRGARYAHDAVRGWVMSNIEECIDIAREDDPTHPYVELAQAELNSMNAENAQLRAEVKRLRDALLKATVALETIDLSGVLTEKQSGVIRSIIDNCHKASEDNNGH